MSFEKQLLELKSPKMAKIVVDSDSKRTFDVHMHRVFKKNRSIAQRVLEKVIKPIIDVFNDVYLEGKGDVMPTNLVASMFSSDLDATSFNCGYDVKWTDIDGTPCSFSVYIVVRLGYGKIYITTRSGTNYESASNQYTLPSLKRFLKGKIVRILTYGEACKRRNT